MLILVSPLLFFCRCKSSNQVTPCGVFHPAVLEPKLFMVEPGPNISVDESTVRRDGCQVALCAYSEPTRAQVLCNYLCSGWLRDISSDWSKHLFETGATTSLQLQVVD